MPAITQLTDEELLRAQGAEELGVFYDRHVRSILGYFARRTGDPDVAADPTAETFASAIVARARFKPGGPPAAAWPVGDAVWAVAGDGIVTIVRDG
jgi:RNA polymerase sigma-70 factor (ECF subfamily)